jgi:hypothetical protein
MLRFPHFLDIWLTDGGKVVSPTPQPPFTPPGRVLVPIFVGGWVDPRGIVQLEGGVCCALSARRNIDSVFYMEAVKSEIQCKAGSGTMFQMTKNYYHVLVTRQYHNIIWAFLAGFYILSKGYEPWFMITSWRFTKWIFHVWVLRIKSVKLLYIWKDGSARKHLVSNVLYFQGTAVMCEPGSVEKMWVMYLWWIGGRGDIFFYPAI